MARGKLGKIGKSLLIVNGIEAVLKSNKRLLIEIREK